MGNDEYSCKHDKPAALAERVKEVETIAKNVGTCMLTTVGTDGALHSRAMRAASFDKLQWVFVYDNTSHKDEEVKQDSHVNISYVEASKGDWISIAGKARTTNEPEQVKKYYNNLNKAWFGDKGDGVHDGTANDPRASVLVVSPNEIRYLATEHGMVTQAAKIVASAVTGNCADLGHTRTITGQEISSL